MKRFIIILIIILVVITSLIYVDYFNTKTNNTYPKLALKSENENAIIYNAVLYRVWYCKANKMYMIGSYTEDNICPKKYEYSNGTYTNSNGVVIAKRDLQMLTNDGVYTSEMIENMTSKDQVEDAVYVVETYMKSIFKVIDETEDYKIIVFPIFKESLGNYVWEYEDNEEDYYCLSNDEKKYAKLDNEECGKYESFKMSKKWCELYKGSTLVYDEGVNSLCKE